MRRVMVACALLIASARVDATTLRPTSATDLVDRAELIFTGTAVERQVATTRDGLYPYTFVTFAVDLVLKGSVDGGRLTLRFEGGELSPEQEVVVPGMPSFEQDGQYLLFVADNGTAISPVVGWQRGVFELVEHPSRAGETLVLDRRGMAVEGIGDGRMLRTSVVREGRSVRRPEAAPPGIEVVEAIDVTITDPLTPDPAKAGIELAPAAVVLQGLQRLVRSRAHAESYRPGAVVRSLTIDDVPDSFSLRPTPADR